MLNSWRLCLVIIVGMVWTSAVAAQNITTHDPAGEHIGAAPAAWSATLERPEPGGRLGPQQESSDETQMIEGDLGAESDSRWFGDILVGDPTYDQVEPAMHKTPDGTLFIAVEQYGVDYDGWVRVYRSINDGDTWTWLVSFKTGTEARNPSLTYAENASGQNWVFLAYEATMFDLTKNILVIRFDPDDINTWDAVVAASGIVDTPDIYPRICTDNLIYDMYYVYVTYTVNGLDYYPVMLTRSLDYGLNFTAPLNITGGAEISSFVTRPDIAYGTAGLFVAFEKLGWTGSAWATQVWVTRSTNYGASWNAPTQLTWADDGAWHPSVAAAVGVSTVMVAYTQSFASQTDIFCSYSTNGGDAYSPSSALPRTFDNEKSVALTVSDSGGRYHAAFWRAYDIMYTYTDATSPLPWAPATLINEANWASSVYSRPAICVNPTRPVDVESCVTWTDYRGTFYDIYFDRAPIPTLTTDYSTISAAIGGSITYFLKAGSSNGGRNYLLLGSATGTTPGMPLPGGHVTFPLNWDAFTDLIIDCLNCPLVYHFYYHLSPLGECLAQLNAPPLDPSYVGLELYFAYCLNNPFDFVSNPVTITIVP
ncbi:MAG: sialidase family protein [Planctomycetota bacterium]